MNRQYRFNLQTVLPLQHHANTPCMFWWENLNPDHSSPPGVLLEIFYQNLRSGMGKGFCNPKTKIVAFRNVPWCLAEYLFPLEAPEISSPVPENLLSNFQMKLYAKCTLVLERLIFYQVSRTQKSAAKGYFEGIPMELERGETVRKC